MKGILQTGALRANDVQNRKNISVKRALDWGVEVTLNQRETNGLGRRCLKKRNKKI